MSRIKKGTALRVLQQDEVIQEGDYVWDDLLFVEKWVLVTVSNFDYKLFIGHKAKDYKYAFARPYPISE